MGFLWLGGVWDHSSQGLCAEVLHHESLVLPRLTEKETDVHGEKVTKDAALREGSLA